MARPTLDQQLAKHAAHVLFLYDLARRGLVPLSKLAAAVDARVLDQLGPFPPPPDGAPLGPARIGGLRVQRLDHDHAHVAAVAHSPSGGVTGYVLELRRDGAVRPWTVTELSTVEERQLVGPDHEDVTDRRTRRLPRDLSGLISATEHARDQAATQLQRAEQDLAATKARPGHGDRQRHDTALAVTDVHQWRRRVNDIKVELQELHDAAALRKIRAAVLAGDPVVSPRLNDLEILLGTVPDDRTSRASWRKTAQRLVDYADTWDVDRLAHDVTTERHRDADPGQTLDRQTMRGLVDAYRADRGWAPPERILVTQLQPGDRVLMPRAHHRILTYRETDSEGKAVFEDDDGRSHRPSEVTWYWRAAQPRILFAADRHEPSLAWTSPDRSGEDDRLPTHGADRDRVGHAIVDGIDEESLDGDQSPTDLGHLQASREAVELDL